MKPKLKKNGFTLIEIIVTLLIVSVLGAMLIPYLMTATDSAKPVTMLNDSLKNQNIIENIIDDYENNYSSDLGGLKSRIGDEETDQDNDYYGVYSVIDNHFVKFEDSEDHENQRNEQTALSEDPKDILKVTIKSANGGVITELFHSQ